MTSLPVRAPPSLENRKAVGTREATRAARLAAGPYHPFHSFTNASAISRRSAAATTIITGRIPARSKPINTSNEKNVHPYPLNIPSIFTTDASIMSRNGWG